jgi:hypothetical protein
MDIPSHKREVLEAIGVALLLLQTAEKVIRLCATFVFPKKSPVTLELLQQQEEAERTKTLGYFLSELRKRVSVHESFDALLKGFLKNRNDFIHDLSRVPTWDIETPETAIEAKQFVFKLIQQTEEVLKVFSGVVLAWQEQVGFSGPPTPNHEWFSEVEKTYKPLVDHLFYAKGT